MSLVPEQQQLLTMKIITSLQELVHFSLVTSTDSLKDSHPMSQALDEFITMEIHAESTVHICC